MSLFPRRELSYVEIVEELYLSLRGKGIMLSPADVAIVERWEEAGIPISAACRAIRRADRAAGAGGVPPLWACDRALHKGRAAPRRGKAEAGAEAGAGEAASSPEAAAVAQSLTEGAAALASLAAGGAAEPLAGACRAAAAQAAAIASSLRAGPAPDLLAVYQELMRLNDELCEAAHGALPAEARAAVEGEVQAALAQAAPAASERARRLLSAAALRQAMRRRGAPQLDLAGEEGGAP